MRAPLGQYELRAPRSLGEALDLLARTEERWQPMAGGTDLMVLLEAGKLPPGRFISLWHLRELRGIDVTDRYAVLGALTTYTDILRHPVLTEEFPLLGHAARETGGVATQNRGTIGGNIANASPAADTPPALLVYDTVVELVSVHGKRLVPYDRFHTGYKTMDLRPGELIGAVRMPHEKRLWKQAYRKVGTRRAQAISKVCFAAAADVDEGVIRDARIAFGSVAPTVLRCYPVEDLLRGQRLTPDLIDAAAGELPRCIAPIDDIRSTAAYRRKVSQNLLREFLRGLS